MAATYQDLQTMEDLAGQTPYSALAECKREGEFISLFYMVVERASYEIRLLTEKGLHSLGKITTQNSLWKIGVFKRLKTVMIYSLLFLTKEIKG